MIDPIEFDALLERYLNGELSEAEGRELAEVLKNHPAAQAAFDRALYDEALLQAAQRPKPDAQRLAGTVTSARAPRRGLRLSAVAAMLALIATGLGAWALTRSGPAEAETEARTASVPEVKAPAAAEPLRCVIFGMVEDGYDGAKFRFRSSLVFRRVAGEAPLAALEGKTFEVQVPGDLSGAPAGREDAVRKLKRGAYATLAVEVDAQGAIKLLKVPEAMGPHYPGQCACRQGIDLPPTQPRSGKTQG